MCKKIAVASSGGSRSSSKGAIYIFHIITISVATSGNFTNYRLKVASRNQQPGLYSQFQPRILHCLLVYYKILSYLKLIIINFKCFVFCCFDSESVSLSKLFLLINHQPYYSRPVSLTSVMCKVMERAVLRALYWST